MHTFKEWLTKLLKVNLLFGFLIIPNQDTVFVYKSPEAFREACNLYEATKTVTPAYLQRVAAAVPSGTKADLLECSWTKALNKVIILEGKSQGTVGWVPIEWYKTEKEEVKKPEPAPKTEVNPQGKEVKSIRVRNKTIKLGDKADDVFAILKPNDRIGNPDVVEKSDQSVRLMVIHHYKVNDKIFDIVLTLPKEQGPYRVKKIIIKESNKK
ncbi:MAG: hypothetical protein PHU44_01410 [Syntrophales bacterium]|nr:hypothetical protein [Syntrophales bacterium]MDD5642100.1 hypothetical protein [Syntrophales bacterium]